MVEVLELLRKDATVANVLGTWSLRVCLVGERDRMKWLRSRFSEWSGSISMFG